MMQSDRKLSSSHGFLGSTSFASVYTENEDLWQAHNSISASHIKTEITAAEVSRGAEVLWLLRDLPLWMPTVEKWAATVKLSMISPWIGHIQTTLRDMLSGFADGATDSQMAKTCHQLSAQFWNNTLRPISFDGSTTFQQYQELISGPNLRWDSVAAYFVGVGLAIEALEYVEDLKLSNDSFSTRRQLVSKMLEAGDACLNFTESTGIITDMEGWVYTEDFHLRTLVSGDAAFSSWKRLGDLISICVAQGLHEEVRPSDQVPFWMSEIRKRAFGVTFICDKGQANFMGRPPRLSRRYCSMQLPLDLDFHHLTLTGDALAKEIDQLDVNGWNVEQETRGTVFVR